MCKDIISEGHVISHPWHLPMTPTQQSPTESIDQHTVDMSDRHSNETHTNKFSRQELPLWVDTERLCFTSHISASSWFYQLRSPQRRTQLAKPASHAGTKRRNIIPRGCWFYQLRSPQRRTQLANPASLAATNRRNIIPRGCEFLSDLCQFAIGRRKRYLLGCPLLLFVPWAVSLPCFPLSPCIDIMFRDGCEKENLPTSDLSALRLWLSNDP